MCLDRLPSPTRLPSNQVEGRSTTSQAIGLCEVSDRESCSTDWKDLRSEP
jgi:hypothetical protein